MFSDASTENTGLPVLQLRGFREEKGLQVASPSSKCEVISDSCVSVLKGFPALGVLSVNGFVQFSPVINGFGELRLCSCDVLKVGIGGIAGMQFKVFKISAFLCVAEGNCINSLWFKVGTGDFRTDVCIFDTSSLNDKSSKGSLFNCVSSLGPYAPFVLIWKENKVLNNHVAVYLEIITNSLFLTLLWEEKKLLGFNWNFNAIWL